MHIFPLEELVRVPTSPTFASVSSSLARSLRGSLRRGSSSSSPYRIQRPSDGDDDSFFVINQADLPGPAHALDDDSGGNSVLARLKNYSRVSLIRRRTSRKADSNIDSIIDAFPSPPTHIPTPAGHVSSAHSDSSHASSQPSAHPKQRRFSASLKHLAKRAISGKKRRAASLPPLYELSAVIQKPLPSVPPEVNSEPDIPAFIYTFVNPVDLTASPTAFTEDLLAPSSRTSFIPPSPSWLSRNVRINTEPSVQLSSLQVPVAPTQSAPASPLPLPIPPPFPHTESALLSPIDIGERLSRLESYTSSESYSPASSSHSSRRSSSSARTLFDQDETETDLSAITDVPKTLLFKPAGSPAPTVIPIPSIAPRERFIPTKEPPLNINLLPPDLVTSAIESIFAQAGLLLSNFNMDAYGKQEGVVDFGGETDYGSFKFFTDLPPPRHQEPEPEQNTSPYIPNVDVIAQNDTFDFSLRAAPNVLYARYKQYGQLGVLAWCSEFGELIDALKTLGFQGNMFVSTRAAALQTCEEILRIRLPDVQMQIIIMYLSSQVARLRRFLDGDRVWDDYPELTFPLEPTATKPPSMT